VSAADVGLDPEVLAYARDVRAALADVPADQLADLLDDLEEHLAEVADDADGPLVARLGPPAGYAAELRRAAGLAGPPAPAGRDRSAGLSRALARVRTSGPVTAVLGFLPELRPAWWVLRAWAALIAVDLVLWGRSSFPLPDFGLGPVVGLVATAAAVTWSVRRGLRARLRDGGRLRPLAVVGNGVLAVLTLIAVVAVADAPSEAQATSEAFAPGIDRTLQHEDGTPITNIHPYSPAGEPLAGVLLYDQDGRPIDNLAEHTGDGLEVVPVPVSPPPPSNAFPQEQQVVTYDVHGVPVPVGPTPTPTSTPVPTPTAPPSEGPAPGPEPAPGPAPEPTP
jgi:hypothetical protein